MRLHPEVEATVTANVARSEEEAEIQAKLGRAIVGDDEEEQQDDGVEEVAPDAAELLEPEALEAIEAPAGEEADNALEEAAADSDIAEGKEEKSD